MPTFTSTARAYPDGTVVGAYPATRRVTGAAPAGAAAGAGTVTAGVLTIEGLSAGVPYVLYAVVAGEHKYADIQIGSARSPSIGGTFAGDFSEGAVPAWSPADEKFIVGAGATQASLDALAAELAGVEAEVDLLNGGIVYVDAPAFGGGPTKTAAENSAAIAAAVAALGAAGGEVRFKLGGYNHGGFNIDGSRGLRFAGLGGMSGNSGEGTRLMYKGTASPAISAKSTFGLHIQDIAILYDNAAFAGDLLDFSQLVADTAYLTVDRCLIGGKGVRGALKLVKLDKVIISHFTDCVFTDAQRLVEGQAAAGSYSNAITFENCTFQRAVAEETRNAGEAWKFDRCTFEQRVLSDGTGAGAGAYAYSAGVFAENLTFDTCWFGDATAVGNWIDFQGKGLVVKGCHMGSGDVGIRLGAGNIEGVEIVGNRFDNIATAGITLNNTGNKNIIIEGNHPFGSTPKVIQFGGTFPLNSRIQTESDTTFVAQVHTFTSAVGDASFPFTPIDGQHCLENVAGTVKACWRVGGAWKKVVIA